MQLLENSSRNPNLHRRSSFYTPNGPNASCVSSRSKSLEFFGNSQNKEALKFQNNEMSFQKNQESEQLSPSKNQQSLETTCENEQNPQVKATANILNEDNFLEEPYLSIKTPTNEKNGDINNLEEHQITKKNQEDSENYDDVKENEVKNQDQYSITPDVASIAQTSFSFDNQAFKPADFNNPSNIQDENQDKISSFYNQNTNATDSNNFLSIHQKINVHEDSIVSNEKELIHIDNNQEEQPNKSHIKENSSFNISNNFYADEKNANEGKPEIFLPQNNGKNIDINKKNEEENNSIILNVYDNNNAIQNNKDCNNLPHQEAIAHGQVKIHQDNIQNVAEENKEIIAKPPSKKKKPLNEIPKSVLIKKASCKENLKGNQPIAKTIQRKIKNSCNEKLQEMKIEKKDQEKNKFTNKFLSKLCSKCQKDTNAAEFVQLSCAHRIHKSCLTKTKIVECPLCKY